MTQVYSKEEYDEHESGCPCSFCLNKISLASQEEQDEYFKGFWDQFTITPIDESDEDESDEEESEPVCSSCEKNEISYDGDICGKCAFRTCGICQHRGWYDDDNFNYGMNDEGEECDVCGECYESNEHTEIELKPTEIELPEEYKI